jgi:Dolichyl-phosphate-mannose-protein mannosyltransferase
VAKYLRAPSRWTLAVAALLAGVLALRLWGVKHGLPYVYNVDENSNFVPTAIGFFSGDYNPHYFINPPAFSYLLHGVFAVWFGGGWPFGASDAVYDAYALHPTKVFVVARVVTAFLGTGAAALVYATGARLFDRRVGLLAAAVLGTAFLPVFYSHLALNDVPALFALTLSVYGSAGVLTQGRRRDYALAGAGLGLAAATKYTAVIAVVPLLAASAHGLVSSDLRRRALQGLALAGAMAVAAFVVANPHAVLSFHEFWDDVQKQERSAGDLGKLGQTYDSGFGYYLWVLTWGIGWVPLVLAAVAVPALVRRDIWRAAFLVPWPVLFVLYMGLQDRYFGRWLLPALPAVALLAAAGGVWLVDRVLAGERARALALGVAIVALVGQGLVYSVHLDRVLSRDDTRNLARAWMVDRVPPGSKIVVEPIVPEAWFADPGKPKPFTPSGKRWIKFLTTRTTIDVDTGRKRRGGVGTTISIEDYERTLRPELVGAYERGGYCWVVIGSTQYGRAVVQPEQVPNALPYYRALAERGRRLYRIDPYEPAEGPVEFNFDWSFDYYPLAYERPGPTVIVYRLDGGACAGRPRGAE